MVLRCILNVDLMYYDDIQYFIDKITIKTRILATVKDIMKCKVIVIQIDKRYESILYLC